MDTPSNNLIKESKHIAKILNERLEVHDNSRRAAQDKLHEICEGLRNQIDEFENKINSELEGNFTAEDSRLQNALNNLRGIDMNKLNDNNEINKFQQAIQKAKAELLVMQSYDLIQCGNEIPSFNPRENDLPNNVDYEEPLNKKKKKERIRDRTKPNIRFNEDMEFESGWKISIRNVRAEKAKRYSYKKYNQGDFHSIHSPRR